MNLFKKTIIIIVLAFCASGCAGVSVSESSNLNDSIRGTVLESFHYTVQDKAVRQYLSTVDLQMMSANRRLEIVVLRELAEVTDAGETQGVFDRLWQEREEVRSIIGSQEDTWENLEACAHPLAEIYYLLSSAPLSAWHMKTASNLYEKRLSHIQPHQLSGYALHFYTMALLNSGKHDVAIPFLRQLEKYTSAEVYGEDLLIALDSAVDNGAYVSACEIVALTCEHSIRCGLEIPDKKIEAALLVVKDADQRETAERILSPLLNRCPQVRECEFALLLKKAESTATDVLPPVPVGNSSLQRPTTASERAHSGFEKVRIEVQVIKAGRQSDYMDPALGSVGDDLRKTLPFSNFMLVNDETFTLGVDERGELLLQNGSVAHITPHDIGTDVARIEVSILDEGKEIFNTFVEAADGGVAIIGGPQVGDKLLLLRLTVFMANIRT